MKALDKKVEEYRKKQLRLNDLKKKLIDAEISWITIVEVLKLSQYEFQKLKVGDLQEREKEVLELIKKTPKHILERDKGVKNFRKLMVDRGSSIKKFCEINKVDYSRLSRTLRGINANRDYEIEKQVEKALGRKVF